MKTIRDRIELRLGKYLMTTVDSEDNDRQLEELLDDLEWLFKNSTQLLLDRIEKEVIEVSGGEIDMKIAVRHRTDAGAGYTIGVNALLKEQRTKLADIKKELL